MRPSGTTKNTSRNKTAGTASQAEFCNPPAARGRRRASMPPDAAPRGRVETPSPPTSVAPVRIDAVYQWLVRDVAPHIVEKQIERARHVLLDVVGQHVRRHDQIGCVP